MPEKIDGNALMRLLRVTVACKQRAFIVSLKQPLMSVPILPNIRTRPGNICGVQIRTCACAFN